MFDKVFFGIAARLNIKLYSHDHHKNEARSKSINSNADHY